SVAACRLGTTGAATRPRSSRPHSARSSGPSSRSPTPAPEPRPLLLGLGASGVVVRLDEDVDLVGALVALLIGHRERRGVLTHLLVGGRRVLIRVRATVAEVPLEGEGSATLLLDRGGELRLERRRALVRVGLRDHVQLVLLFLRRTRRLRGRRRTRG